MLEFDKHSKFIERHQELQADPDDINFKLLEHLSMSAYYWAICGLNLLGTSQLNHDKIVEFIVECQQEDGGFGGSIGHDFHLLYTLSAVQILVMLDKVNVIDVDKVVNYVVKLYQEDGSFMGDAYGEIDTRFSYCAVACLSLLDRLNVIQNDKVVEFIMKCHNFDGGFGSTIGSESHGGQIFTCLGTLAICDALDVLSDKDIALLGWWLSERQLSNGGMNGRPEKKEDVCYSWWNLSSLAIINKIDMIDKDALVNFIVRCQDPNGGICHQENQIPDLFHTLFGLTGLSLLQVQGMNAIDPVYCIPKHLLKIKK